MRIDPDEFEGYEEDAKMRPVGNRGGRLAAKPPKLDRQAIESSETDEKEKARRRVSTVETTLVRNADDSEREARLEEYHSWRDKCIADDALYLDVDADIITEHFRYTGPGRRSEAGSDPGIRAKHIVSGINAQSAENGDSILDKQIAISKLSQRLLDHLHDCRLALK